MTDLWPRKFHLPIQISNEQMAILIEEQRSRTPETIRAENTARQESQRAEFELIHEALAKADPALQPVIKLHAGPAEPHQYWQCDGCDLGAYAEEAPGWPCRTIKLILENIENEATP